MAGGAGDRSRRGATASGPVEIPGDVFRHCPSTRFSSGKGPEDHRHMDQATPMAGLSSLTSHFPTRLVVNDDEAMFM
jgi:hypothetical protein